MRENTRWEVDEPISTPTLSTTISSSSTSERPVEVKKMRPPWASSSVTVAILSRAGEFGHHRALLIEGALHPALHAFRFQPGLVLAADEGVLHPVGDGGAALRDVHAGVVDVLLARRARLAARIVRAEP